ncbi:MAG: cysteine--tRNA ligase [Microthrixaceae bacterium]
MIRLYDTAARQVLPLEPRTPGEVSMYVCGPTVYGPPHLGHGRFSLVFDVLRRYLEWSGNRVRYVSNITDIDDKIIDRAEAEGRPWTEVTAEFEAVWWDAMDAMGVRRPDEDPHATAYVDRMVELISDLVAADRAYATDDGVYLSVEQVDGYGLLAHQSLDQMVAGGGEREVHGAEHKRHPADFALWKFAKPGEPAWPSPWGDGRPGWHTECVVMSLDLLGDGFDLHGGGLDLAFPHHENERAQAVAAGRDFARRWVHNGFVEVGGEKMSKSLGNFTTLSELLEQHDARAYRLLVLRAHYRRPLEVTADTIAQAEATLERLDAFARRTAGLAEVEPHDEVLDAFRAHMDDDLDTPGALAALFDVVSEVNRLLDTGDTTAAGPLAAAVRSALDAVGLDLRDPDGDLVPDEVAALARARDRARAEKDWGMADQLRDELVALGWVVEDTPGGTVVRRA